VIFDFQKLEEIYQAFVWLLNFLKKENSAVMRWLRSERELQLSTKFSNFQRPRFEYYTVEG
jgi:hypothetical protein